jgi:hypothetical protein
MIRVVHDRIVPLEMVEQATVEVLQARQDEVGQGEVLAL